MVSLQEQSGGWTPDNKKVKEHWNSYGGNQKRWWLHNKFVRKQVHLHPIGWTKGLCWFNWMQRQYAAEKPFSRALSLCCGSGAYDRRMAKLRIAEAIHGIDISPGQLERARDLAAKEGFLNVEYSQADVTKEVLPENNYDFILSIGALHHLTELPHVLEQLHRALTPEGILIISEYVGPDHMDYTPWERGLMQGALASLPQRYRVRAMDGKIQERAGHVTREMVIARDPSEGVNASQIYPNLRRFFEPEIEVQMGHSLLREVLNDIVDNFEDGNERDEEYLMNLINLDRTLRREGLIENHHIAGVYRPLKRA